MDRVSGRVTDRVRVRVRRPDSSGNLLLRRKLHYAPQIMAIYRARVRTARSVTQWLITVRLTSRPNVSDQTTQV